MIVIWFL